MGAAAEEMGGMVAASEARVARVVSSSKAVDVAAVGLAASPVVAGAVAASETAEAAAEAAEAEATEAEGCNCASRSRGTQDTWSCTRSA